MFFIYHSYLVCFQILTRDMMHGHISSIIVDLKIRSTPTNKTQPCSSLLVKANYIHTLLCNVSTICKRYKNVSFSFFCKRYAIVDLHPYGSHKGKSNCVIFMGRNGRSFLWYRKTTHPFIHSFCFFSAKNGCLWKKVKKLVRSMIKILTWFLTTVLCV